MKGSSNNLLISFFTPISKDKWSNIHSQVYPLILISKLMITLSSTPNMSFQSFEFTKWKSLSPIRSKFSVSSLSLNNWCSGSPPFSVLSQYCDFPGGSDGTSVCLQCGRPGFDPLVRKIPWRRKWQSTLVLLPGKSYGWRSLVGYSPWVIKESDMTDQLHFLSF